MGGLSRKAFMIEKKVDDTALPFLSVDAGALFFAKPFLPASDLAQAKITATGIAQAYAKMGFAAINVGRRDLTAGVQFLKKATTDAALTLVSANIKKPNGDPFFIPVLLKKIQGITVAITGVADHNSTLPQGNEEITIVPWRTVLPDLVKKLQAESDIVVVLSNYSPRENLTMAKEIPEVDIIIQSGHSGANMGPKRVGYTALLQTEKRGKYLGVFRVRWRGNGEWRPIDKNKNNLSRSKQELDGLTWQIRRRARRLNKKQKKTDRIYLKMLKEKKELKQAISALEKKQDTAAKKQTVSTGPFFGNAFIPLPLSIPEDLDVRNIVLETEKKVAMLGRRSRPTKKPDVPLVGWRSCMGCHEPQTAFWKKTNHFKAYDTLVNKEKETTLSCLPCHVTAPAPDIETDSAHLLALPEDLRGVTCEACHGSGALHSTAPTAHSMRRRPKPSTCRRCHTPERDDDFVYSRDSERIACPAR